MLVNRSAISRFAFPQTRAEWEELFSRCLAMLAAVPLNRWQFVVRCLLILSLSLSLAHFFWLIFPTPAIPPAAIAIPQAINHLDSAGSGVNIAQLKTLHVFGKAEAPKQDAPAVIESQAVETHLNLVLVGVISSSDEKSGRAIIASGDKQDVYAVGDAIPVGNGVSLSKVMPDRVIINNNGQYESLWLYQNDPSSKISQLVAPPPPPSVGGGTPQAWVQAPGRPGPNGPIQQTPDGPSVNDPALAQVTRNLNDVMSMSIYRENGEVVGYKIKPGRDAEKFKALGLETDDIVTAINGMPLTNPAKIMEVYKSMGNATSASLEIKRGGGVITVDVVLQ